MIKILTVGQTPPPFHGQAISIQNIIEGKYRKIKNLFVRMDFSEEIDDIGKFHIAKALKLPIIILKIIYKRFRHKALILHYPPCGPERLPMYRDLAILLSTRFLFKKTIFYFHANGISELYNRLYPLEKMLFWRAYFGPDLAIKQSMFGPPDGEFLRARKIVIIDNAERDHYPEFAPLREQRINKHLPVLLFVGVLRESKGVMVLLEACLKLKDLGVPFQTNIMGKWESDEFRKKAQAFVETHNLSEVINFLGALTGDKKWRTYCEADVLVFPSFFESESFGRVLIEAMQFEIPVVATRWRGISSIVEDGKSGLLVPIKDSQALAEKIAILLKDPELRKKMGERGREIYLERFTIERFWRNIEEAFLSVA